MTINIVCLVSFLTAATFQATSTRRTLMEDLDSRNQTRRSSVVEPSVVCEYTEYEVKDLSTIATMFKRFAVKKARVVRFHVKLTERCLQKRSITTPNYRFDLVWALSEEEPYMSLPPEFLRFSDILSPGLRQERNISMDCSVNERSSVNEFNDTTSRLHGDAVTKTLVRNLMQSSGGILCSVPQKSEIKNNSYSCCKFQETTPDIECNLVQFPEFGNWSLNVLWAVFVLPLLTLFLPAVVCLFPCWEVSEDGGTPCIVLAAPSSVGLRSWLVKLFVPRKMDRKLDKRRFFILRSIIIPLLIVSPQLFLYVIALYSLNSAFSLQNALQLPFLPFIALFLSACLGDMKVTPSCIICQRVFSKVHVHSNMSERIKKHMFLLPSFLEMHCREFGWHCRNVLKTVCDFCFDLHCCSKKEICYSLCRLICSPFLIAVVLGGILGGILCFLYSLFICSPLYNSLNTKQVFGKIKEYRVRVKNVPLTGKVIEFITEFIVPLFVLCIIYTCASTGCDILLYTMMVITANRDASFLPRMTFSVLVLYYLYSFYSTYSEKYQLLKIKLYEGIQEKKKEEEGYGALILYTKSKAPAISEKLYKAACTEFSKSFVSYKFYLLLLKIVGVIIFVVVLHRLVIIFGSHTGMNPRIQALAIFMAGSFPKVCFMFSSGENTEKLEEIDMQERLINQCIQEYRIVTTV